MSAETPRTDAAASVPVPGQHKVCAKEMAKLERELNDANAELAKLRSQVRAIGHAHSVIDLENAKLREAAARLLHSTVISKAVMDVNDSVEHTSPLVSCAHAKRIITAVIDAARKAQR